MPRTLPYKHTNMYWVFLIFQTPTFFVWAFLYIYISKTGFYCLLLKDSIPVYWSESVSRSHCWITVGDNGYSVSFSCKLFMKLPWSQIWDCQVRLITHILSSCCHSTVCSTNLHVYFTFLTVRCYSGPH